MHIVFIYRASAMIFKMLLYSPKCKRKRKKYSWLAEHLRVLEIRVKSKKPWTMKEEIRKRTGKKLHLRHTYAHAHTHRRREWRDGEKCVCLCVCGSPHNHIEWGKNSVIISKVKLTLRILSHSIFFFSMFFLLLFCCCC